MSGSLSIGGLISGIDTNTMLDQLYEMAQAPIRRLESRKEGLNRKSAAWSQFEALALTFRGLAVQLATPTGFRLYSARVSAENLASASVGSSAAPGTYTFTVQALEQTHQLAAQGYADTDETSVGTGTVSIAVGGGEAVVVDVADLTLVELRDAINGAGAGVSAAIINDGSATSPYRLVLTSETSGLDGEMGVTVDLAGGTAPTFLEMQAAQDAQIQLGSGAGAVTISSGSNTISGAIPGVTLTLLAADPATPVTLTVSRDTAAVQSRIDEFAAAYNAVVGFFGEQFDFDPETGWAGVLFADYRLEGLQHDLARSVSNAIVGAMGEFTSLSQIGIRVQANGTLVVESATLASALSGSFDDVVGVFAARGATTHDDVTYLTGTSETQPSGAAGWAVEITQAATRSRVTAGVAQTAALAAEETLTINGVNVSLSAGMTQSEVVAAINAAEDQTGMVAAATGADGEGTGNYLTLTRAAYGSAYHVEAVSTVSNQGGGGAASGIGTTMVTDGAPLGESGVGTGAAGLDVAGTIDGEECTGVGRRLRAEAGDPTGLSLLVTGTSAGSYGVVNFTVGAAESAFRVCLSATDTVDGTVARAQDTISDTMDDIDGEIIRLQELIEHEQERLRASFVAMERALAQFESQSQFLTSQMAQMQANASNS